MPSGNIFGTLRAAVSRITGGSEDLQSAGGAAFATDAIDINGNAQASIVLATSAVQSGPLPGGIYDVWATNDCYIKVDAIANNVTANTGYLLRAGNTIPIIIPEQLKIGAIVLSGTATLYYHRVK